MWDGGCGETTGQAKVILQTPVSCSSGWLVWGSSRAGLGNVTDTTELECRMAGVGRQQGRAW